MPANFNLLLLDIAWYYNKFSSELHKENIRTRSLMSGKRARHQIFRISE